MNQANKLTPAQALIITGYTGVLCCDWSDFQVDVERRLGHSVFTHEFAGEAGLAMTKELYRADFMAMIAKPEVEVASEDEEAHLDQTAGLHKMVLRMPIEIFEEVRKAAAANGTVWQAEARRRLQLSDSAAFDSYFYDRVELSIGATVGSGDDELVLCHAKDGAVLAIKVQGEQA